MFPLIQPFEINLLRPTLTLFHIINNNNLFVNDDRGSLYLPPIHNITISMRLVRWGCLAGEVPLTKELLMLIDVNQTRWQRVSPLDWLIESSSRATARHIHQLHHCGKPNMKTTWGKRGTTAVKVKNEEKQKLLPVAWRKAKGKNDKIKISLSDKMRSNK